MGKSKILLRNLLIENRASSVDISAIGSRGRSSAVPNFVVWREGRVWFRDRTQRFCFAATKQSNRWNSKTVLSSRFVKARGNSPFTLRCVDGPRTRIAFAFIDATSEFGISADVAPVRARECCLRVRVFCSVRCRTAPGWRHFAE